MDVDEHRIKRKRDEEVNYTKHEIRKRVVVKRVEKRQKVDNEDKREDCMPGLME